MREEIVIAGIGAGGDGVTRFGEILLRAAAHEGYYGRLGRFFGAMMRGGPSAVRLSLYSQPYGEIRDAADILVCFNWREFPGFQSTISVDGKTMVFCEEEPPSELGLSPQYYKIPFTEISNETVGSTLAKNIVAVGVVARILGFSEEIIKQAIRATFQGKHQSIIDANLRALEKGWQCSQGFNGVVLSLKPLTEAKSKIITDGNEVIAKAAIRAGCRFFAGYPITPASEIMAHMKNLLPKVDGKFDQAEDEIAALGLCIGASWAGLKVMDATSGAGFDLKTEMLGLAVACETPLVLVNVQRGGPSTGLSTKTEQGDLNHVIYAGHGDAPRVVLAAVNAESCYRLTMEAFNIAETYQVPVILVSDQYLAHTLVAVDSDFLEQEYQVVDRKRPAETELKDYRRFRVTESFVSPMLDWGDPRAVYQIHGLSHDEYGQADTSPEMHQRMIEKRQKKLEPLVQSNLVVVSGNPDAKVGIITWGSSAEAVLGAVKNLGIENRVKIYVPELISPVPVNYLREFVESLSTLLVVEMNYSGQFLGHLRRNLDIPANLKIRNYRRAGGRPLSVKEVSDWLQKEVLN